MICRPATHWAEAEQCRMFTLPWHHLFVGNPLRARQDHPSNPPSWHYYPSTSLGNAANGQMRSNLSKQALPAKLEPTAANWCLVRPSSLLAFWTKSAKGAKRCRGRGTNKAVRAVSLICVRGPAAAKWTRLLGAGVGTDLGPRSGDTGSGRQRTHPAVRLDSLTPRFMDYSTC